MVVLECEMCSTKFDTDAPGPEGSWANCGHGCLEDVLCPTCTERHCPCGMQLWMRREPLCSRCTREQVERDAEPPKKPRLLPVLFVEVVGDHKPTRNSMNMYSLIPREEEALLAYRAASADPTGLLFITPDTELKGVLSVRCTNEDDLPEGVEIPGTVPVKTLESGAVDMSAYRDVVCIMRIQW